MSIILPTTVVSVIGLVFGIILAIAAIVMAVPKDEKSEAILEVLPGANCGGCGYSGCAGYADAISKDNVELNLCPPGGPDVAAQIAAILGMEASGFVKKGAFVKCQGTIENTAAKAHYQGVFSCAAAKMYLDGPQRCIYGCMGYGDCLEACAYDAIEIIDGLATIDLCKCTACGKCVRSCPKGLIELLPLETGKALVLCCNHEKGAETKSNCSIGCIACSRCVKACPSEAITIENNLAIIDQEKCTACGKCVEVCPSDCIAI